MFLSPVTNEETKAQREQVVCPWLFGKSPEGPGSEPLTLGRHAPRPQRMPETTDSTKPHICHIFFLYTQPMIKFD